MPVPVALIPVAAGKVEPELPEVPTVLLLVPLATPLIKAWLFAFEDAAWEQVLQVSRSASNMRHIDSRFIRTPYAPVWQQ